MARPDLDGVREHRRRRLLQHRRRALDPRDPLQHEPHGDPARQPRLRAHQEAGVADLAARNEEQHDAARRRARGDEPADGDARRAERVVRRAGASTGYPSCSTTSSPRRISHRGFSFIRVIQRCPEFLPKMFEPWLHDPAKTLLLTHKDGLQLSPETVPHLQEPARARPARHPPGARDRVRRGSDPGRHPLSESRRALLRGPARSRAATHAGTHPRRTRGRARQGHGLARTRAPAPAQPEAGRATRTERHPWTWPRNSRTNAVFHMTGNRAGDGLAPVDVGSPATGAPRPLPRPGAAALRLPARAGPKPRRAASTPTRYRASSTRCCTLLAPRGIEGERLRKHVLRLEREMRTMVAAGANGTLSELWARAAERLSAGVDETVAQVLAQAGGSLPVDGEVADCDPALAGAPARARVAAAQAREGARVPDARRHADAQALRHPARGVRAFGSRPAAGGARGHRSAAGTPTSSTSPSCRGSSRGARRRTSCHRPRRGRIEWALRVLAAQPFYADPRCHDRRRRLRFPVRRLRVGGSGLSRAAARADRGRQGDRDRRARGRRRLCRGGITTRSSSTSTSSALTADDLALFPDYLVCIPPDATMRRRTPG